MKTFCKYLVGVVILLFALMFFSWNMLAGYVSKTLTEKAGVEVSISSIHASPFSVSVKNCKVQNVPNSILPYALKIDDIDVNAPLTRFFKQDIVINEITLDDMYMGVELDSMYSSKNNWTQITNNIQRNTGSSAKEESSTTFLIKKLVLTNINIDLAFKDKKDVRHLKPIPRMEFKNVSSQGGLPTAQFMNIIMNEVLKSILSPENLGNLIKQGLNLPGSAAKGLVNPFGLFSLEEQEDSYEK